jgi:hypothetical protein
MGNEAVDTLASNEKDIPFQNRIRNLLTPNKITDLY